MYKEIMTGAEKASVMSEESETLTAVQKEALVIKEKGNEAYKAKEFDAALACFSAAIEKDGDNATFLCNRSMCFASLGQWEDSLQDGKAAVGLDKKYVKAYCRVMKACVELVRLEEARISCLAAVKECGEQKEFRALEKEIGRLCEVPVRPVSSDFEVLEQLGEGNFSSIVKCKLKSTGKVYAVKMIEKQKVERMKRRHPNINNEIFMEKRVLHRLKHANIVPLYSTFQDYGTLYFHMEFMEGGELFSKILDHDNYPVGAHPSVGTYLLAEALNALEYMHRRGVVHRDIKPENMLLTTSGHLKFVDFGTAKDLLMPDLNGPEFVGTPEYMSPQTIKSQVAGPAVDLWALGVVAFQVFTGSTPFESASPYLTFLKIKRGFLRTDVSVTDDVRAFLEKTLTMDPAERFRACARKSSTKAVLPDLADADGKSKAPEMFNYDPLRELPLFTKMRSVLPDAGGDFTFSSTGTAVDGAADTVSLLCSLSERPAIRVAKLSELCRRALCATAEKLAELTAAEGGVRPPMPWARQFDLSEGGDVPAEDRAVVAAILRRRGRLHPPSIYRLFWSSSIDARCIRVPGGEFDYLGFSRRRCGRWEDNYFFAHLTNPCFGLGDGSATGDSAETTIGILPCHEEERSMRSAITSINRSRPKFVVVTGNFTHAQAGGSGSGSGSGEDISVSVAQRTIFRKAVSRISESIPLLLVCGPADVGMPTTPALLDSYNKAFGNSFYGFWYGGVRIVVVNSSLLIDPSMAPEEAASQDRWLEEEIEQGKLAATHVFVFSYHAWVGQGPTAMPKDVQDKWIPFMRHPKIRLLLSVSDTNKTGQWAHVESKKKKAAAAVEVAQEEAEVPFEDFINAEGEPLRPSQILAQTQIQGNSSSTQDEESTTEEAGMEVVEEVLRSDSQTPESEMPEYVPTDSDSDAGSGDGGDVGDDDDSEASFHNLDMDYYGPEQWTTSSMSASVPGNSPAGLRMVKVYEDDVKQSFFMADNLPTSFSL